MSFEVYVDGDYVLDGTGVDAVSGTFTMPDLGDDGWTVGVAAVIWDSDRRRKIERAVDYLGQALPPARPPAPTVPSAAPAVAPQGSSSPAPSSSPASVGGTSTTPSAPSSSHRSQRSRTRRATKPARQLSRRGERHGRAHRARDRRKRHAAKRKHGKRSVRWVRLPYPRRGAVATSGEGVGYVSLNAIAPHTAVLAAEHVRAGGDGANAAIVVPALLGLATLALAGTAVLRRRRLASRPRRD